MDKQECRICTEYVDSTNLIELLEVYTEIIIQIRDVVGVELICGTNVPSSVCRKCYTDLEIAQEFRRRCIDSNEYFRSKFEQTNLEHDIILKEEENPLSPHPNSNEAFEYFDEQRNESDSESIENKVIEDIEENIPAKTLTKESIKSDEKRKAEVKTSHSALDSDGSYKEHSESEGDDVAKERRTKNQTKSKNRMKKPSCKTKGLLRTRKPTTKSTSPLICDICGNLFKAKHVFLLHLRRHSNNKPYDCELCKSSFYTNSELKRHMRRHTGEKPYECQYCHRKFSDYGTHTKHERTHTNDRPFSCNQCGKSFSCGFVLKNHMLTHTGERAFKCEICDKSFGRQHNLTTHMKSIYHQQNKLKKEYKLEV